MTVTNRSKLQSDLSGRREYKYKRKSTEWDSEAYITLMRDACRRDFWTFFLYAFGAGSNPRGLRWIEESVHRPAAEWFQSHVDPWFEKRHKGSGEQLHLAILVHREV